MSDFPTTTPASVNSYETGFATAPATQSVQSFAEQAGETPEAVRAFAEKTIAQFRETYAQTRQSMEEATRALEVSLGQASKGTSEFNTKVMEMAQRNVNSGFDFARKMASARTQAEAVELQTAFMRQQLDAVFAEPIDPAQNLDALQIIKLGGLYRAADVDAVDESRDSRGVGNTVTDGRQAAHSRPVAGTLPACPGRRREARRVPAEFLEIAHTKFTNSVRRKHRHCQRCRCQWFRLLARGYDQLFDLGRRGLHRDEHRCKQYDAANTHRSAT